MLQSVQYVIKVTRTKLVSRYTNEQLTLPSIMQSIRRSQRKVSGAMRRRVELFDWNSICLQQAWSLPWSIAVWWCHFLKDPVKGLHCKAEYHHEVEHLLAETEQCKREEAEIVNKEYNIIMTLHRITIPASSDKHRFSTHQRWPTWKQCIVGWLSSKKCRGSDWWSLGWRACEHNTPNWSMCYRALKLPKSKCMRY